MKLREVWNCEVVHGLHDSQEFGLVSKWKAGDSQGGLVSEWKEKTQAW